MGCSKRRADSIEGDSPSHLEIISCENGDVFVEISGQDSRGNCHVVRVQFLSQLGGGGYHPNTIAALYGLMGAIEKDNHDPACPRRYLG